MNSYRWGDYTPTFNAPAPLFGKDKATPLLNYLGADGGYECALDNERSFWALSDTYHSALGHPISQRYSGIVISPTIGIGTCHAGMWSIQYYHGGTSKSIQPFFNDEINDSTGCRFWTQKPFMYNKKLYVLMARMENSLHFICAGTVIARVNNPTVSPTDWDVDYLTLTSGYQSDGVPILGLECFTFKTDLILYGSVYNKTVACTVNLLALETTPDGGNISDNFPIRYLSLDGSWQEGYQGGNDFWDCQIPATAGFSCRLNSTIKCWQSVYTDTNTYGGFPSYAVIKTSASPFGPWSEARVLGYFPEMAPMNPTYDKDNCVYACKEVTDFCSDPGRQVTLVYTNASRSAMAPLRDPTRQLSDLTCYINKTVKFKNPFT